MRLHIRFCGRMILGFITLCCLKMIFSYCNRNSNENNENESDFEIEPDLLDDILNAAIQPTIDGSIFFHQTSSLQKDDINFANLTARKACAVEAAALHNPNTNIFVMFSVTAFWAKDYKNDIMNALLSYPNVHLRNVDLWEFANNTPIYHWFKTFELFESKYISIHVADFLRLVTLYRYGGTHLDFDLVILRSLEDLPPNYAVAQSDGKISTGVVNFASFGVGHIIADYCLRDFEANFNFMSIHGNGPDVLTRVLLYACETTDLGKMFDPKNCQGFKVFPPDTFCAITWDQCNDFFDERKVDITYKRLYNSCLADLWNNLSEPRKHLVGVKTAFSLFAERNCPKVYGSAGEILLKR